MEIRAMNLRLNLAAFKRITGNQKNISAIFIMGLLLLATFTLALNIGPVSAVGPTPVPLGTAAYFSVLAGSGITVAGAVNSTTITGDIGTFPTPAIIGLGNLVLNGVNHAGDAVTQNAQNDLLAAYSDAAGRAATTTYTPIYDLGGLTLTSGVYNDPSSFAITGTLTLDGGGNPNAVFIFQAGSTLITAAGSQVNLINGAKAQNVFWQVGSSATLGASSGFEGTILASQSITLNTYATADGGMLAMNAAVNLDGYNTIAIAVVPEPGSTLLFISGLAILFAFRRQFLPQHIP